MRLMETPVTIPNTEVKRQAVEGTFLEAERENRWLPNLFIISVKASNNI